MCRLHVVDLQQRDLADLRWVHLDGVYRTDSPVLLRYRFRELPWVAICAISPKGTAFLAVKVYPAFGMALREWTACRADEGSTFRRFLKELAFTGVAPESEAVAFLGQYSTWGVYGKKHSSPFLKSAANPLSQSRFVAMVVPVDAERIAIEYLEKQLEEFGSHSFVDIVDEWPVTRYRLNTPTRLEELNDPLFEWPCGYEENGMSVSSADILNRLKELKTPAAVGKYLDSIHPISALTLSPCFRLENMETPEMEKVFSLRATVLAEADAPWLIPAMKAQELAIERKVAIDARVHEVGSEVLERIGEFLSRMESKYPVIPWTTRL